MRWIRRNRGWVGFSLVAAFLVAVSGSVAAVGEAVIRVFPDRSLGSTNFKVLGNNVVATKADQDARYSSLGGGLWDAKNNHGAAKMISLAGAAASTTLRWPGGCGVHAFNWKTTVGPLEARAKQPFGLSEFLRLAEEIGAAPVITLSDYTGDAIDAADLVEYLNSPIGENPNDGIAWARMRAADGHPEPYRVKYFEYGNESAHGFHHTGEGTFSSSRRYSPEQYSQKFRDYRAAMKAVDGAIQLGAVLNDDRTPSLSYWTRAIIKNTGDVADYFIYHAYLPAYSGNDGSVSATDLFRIAFAAPRQFELVFEEINNFIRREVNRAVPLAVTEFNGSFVQERPVQYRFTLGNAVLVADLLQVLLTPRNNILHAQYWQFANEYWGMIKGYEPPYTLRPAYHVFSMYKAHLGSELIQTDIGGSGYEQGGGYGVVPARGSGSSFRLVGASESLSSGWEISPLLGADAAVDGQGVLAVNITSGSELNYHHARLKTGVAPNSGYRVTAEIRAEGLNRIGARLEAGDIRGWKATGSVALSEMVSQDGWTKVSAEYFTLPDTKEIGITARRLGRSPERGRFWIRNVRIQRFQPFLLPRIPYVGAFSTRDADRVAVFLVNRNVAESVPIKIVAPSKGGAVGWTLSGPAVDATNEKDPGTVAVHNLKVNFANNAISALLPPHSFSVVEFRVQNGAK